ncbi:RING/U-box superfamily protein [Euphorbia peplus]|nr:RING/U-box superfamily protein [Euphorbia peplus]
MGSSGSTARDRKGKCRRNWGFPSSCLGARDDDDNVKENGANLSTAQPRNGSSQVKVECYRKVKLEEDSETNCVSTSVLLDDWNVPTASSARALSTSASTSQRSSVDVIHGNETHQTIHLLPTSRIQNQESTSASSHHHNQGNHAITSTPSGDGNGSHSPTTHTNSDSFETRVSDRRNGAQETVEPNVCFSRTLSVGRLRDRVLRRSSGSDATFCPFQQEQQVRDVLQDIGAETLTSEMRISETEQHGLLSPTTSGYAPATSSSMLSVHNHELEATRSRDTRYHDLLEHRSNFLERRRRIRSQVRALQRLGSRFENLSGHERSCILSGHHRSGRCTCRLTNRDANLSDDTSARASISRIVMLAEALFEVLDEIHQQSVVMSSQPSVSALGSVPAPNEVVESLPVKLYPKSQKHQHEEAAQCYICLVEYEEGDSMRVLPCHHEFHTTCIDKWLKEIHRVCPLCRGDICTSDSLPGEN